MHVFVVVAAAATAAAATLSKILIESEIKLNFSHFYFDKLNRCVTVFLGEERWEFRRVAAPFDRHFANFFSHRATFNRFSLF